MMTKPNGSTQDRLAEAIAVAHRLGQTCHVPLLRAAREGVIALRLIMPGERAPARDFDVTALRQPAVVLLCGDDGSGRHRPSDFPQAVRWLRWARAIMLHGTGGREEHYMVAVIAAQVARRVLVVDLPSYAIPEWAALVDHVAPRAGKLMLTPPAGGTHPVGERVQ